MKVDTIAPDESFSRLDTGVSTPRCAALGRSPRLASAQPSGPGRLHVAHLRACILQEVCVHHRRLALFPETLTGAEPTSLVIAPAPVSPMPWRCPCPSSSTATVMGVDGACGCLYLCHRHASQPPRSPSVAVSEDWPGGRDGG